MSSITEASAASPAHRLLSIAGSREVRTPAAEKLANHIDDAQLQEALATVRSAVSSSTPNLQFEMDRATGKTLIKVINSETGDIIRQIPGDEMLAIAKALEGMKGSLVNDSV